MIAFLQSMPVGNAARVILAPPFGAERFRVLRKLTDDMAAVTDSGAATVYDASADDELGFIDTTALENGVVYHYRPFYLIDGTWTPGPSSSVQVRADLGSAGPDVYDLVRARLDAGLRAEVAANRLPASKGLDGKIAVLTAPPLYEETPFPIVTVHLQGDTPSSRGIGMTVAPAYFDGDAGDFDASEGALNRVDLLIVGHVINNPDLRVRLGQALKRVLTANMDVFAAAGMVNPSYSLSHAEELEAYNAPLFQAVCTFTCEAPDVVTFTDPAIADVDVEVDVYSEAA